MLIASTWYWWTVLNLLLKSQFISLLSDMSLLSIEEDLSIKMFDDVHERFESGDKTRLSFYHSFTIAIVCHKFN